MGKNGCVVAVQSCDRPHTRQGTSHSSCALQLLQSLYSRLKFLTTFFSATSSPCSCGRQ